MVVVQDDGGQWRKLPSGRAARPVALLFNGRPSTIRNPRKRPQICESRATRTEFRAIRARVPEPEQLGLTTSFTTTCVIERAIKT